MKSNTLFDFFDSFFAIVQGVIAAGFDGVASAIALVFGTFFPS